MKRVLILIIAFVFAIFFMPLRSFAAYELTYAVGSGVAATQGGSVTVPISVTNNPGFTSVGFIVAYDPNVLQISSVSAPVSAMPLNSQFALTETPGTQWIHLINPSLANWSGAGTIVNMTFDVKPTAPAGMSYIILSFTGIPDGKPGNSAGDIIKDAVLISGSVNVVAGGAAASPSPTASPSPSPSPSPSGSSGSGSGGTPNYFFSNGNSWIKGAGVNQGISVAKDFNNFGSVRVDGVTLTKNVDYEVKSEGGSTVVTLYGSYLESLPVGQHSLEVRFTDGEIVSSPFSIFVNPQIPQAALPADDGYVYDYNSGNNSPAAGDSGGNQSTASEPSSDGGYKADNGGFIGEPYTNDNTGASPAPASPAKDGGKAVAGATKGFGAVPQTGVIDVADLAVLMVIMALTAAALWVRALRKFRGK